MKSYNDSELDPTPNLWGNSIQKITVSPPKNSNSNSFDNCDISSYYCSSQLTGYDTNGSFVHASYNKDSTLQKYFVSNENAKRFWELITVDSEEEFNPMPVEEIPDWLK